MSLIAESSHLEHKCITKETVIFSCILNWFINYNFMVFMWMVFILYR
jgi:hypothetical protein